MDIENYDTETKEHSNDNIAISNDNNSSGAIKGLNADDLSAIAKEISINVNSNIEKSIKDIKDDILISNNNSSKTIIEVANKLEVVLSDIKDAVTPITENNARLEKVFNEVIQEVKEVVRSNNEAIAHSTKIIRKFQDSIDEDKDKLSLLDEVNLLNVEKDLVNKYGKKPNSGINTEIKKTPSVTNKSQKEKTNTVSPDKPEEEVVVQKGFLPFIKYILGIG